MRLPTHPRPWPRLALLLLLGVAAAGCTTRGPTRAVPGEVAVKQVPSRIPSDAVSRPYFHDEGTSVAMAEDAFDPPALAGDAGAEEAGRARDEHEHPERPRAHAHSEGR